MPTVSSAFHHSPAVKDARKLSGQLCIYTAIAVRSFDFAQDDDTRMRTRNKEASFQCTMQESAVGFAPF